jgi:hypothetical protein
LETNRQPFLKLRLRQWREFRKPSASIGWVHPSPSLAILGGIRRQGAQGLRQKIDDRQFQLGKEVLKLSHPPELLQAARVKSSRPVPPKKLET